MKEGPGAGRGVARPQERAPGTDVGCQLLRTDVGWEDGGGHTVPPNIMWVHMSPPASLVVR